MGAAGLAAGSLERQLRRGIRKEAKMAVKGRVIYVGQSNGQGVRIGAKSPDGLTWWWTQKGKAPKKGQTVEVPRGAKPEPGRRIPGELARESEIARAVALKAAVVDPKSWTDFRPSLESVPAVSLSLCHFSSNSSGVR